MTKKIDQEIADHPERFDYADIPPHYDSKEFEAYNRAMDKRRPAWLKKFIVDAHSR